MLYKKKWNDSNIHQHLHQGGIVEYWKSEQIKIKIFFFKNINQPLKNMKRYKHTPPSSYSSKTRSNRIKSLNLNIPDHYKRCEICRSTFKCPKVLPCMHVFCLRCLQLCWRLKNDGRDGEREGKRGSGGIRDSSERDSGLGLSGGTTTGRMWF